ncbi:hypothetical protein EU546_02885 [Candidatus Thorarchaeota archaeon]|nr:MAG: hypothetical protein EU546_02885 [Candidatus Thorarchaeota archaeon]
MPERGEYGDTTQRCAYCGRAKVSWFWSVNSFTKTANYCSLECSARDNKTHHLMCALCVLPVTIVMSLGVFSALIQQIPVDPTLVILYGAVLFFQISIGYAVYVGYRPAERGQ